MVLGLTGPTIFTDAFIYFSFPWLSNPMNFSKWVSLFPWILIGNAMVLWCRTYHSIELILWSVVRRPSEKRQEKLLKQDLTNIIYQETR